MLAFPFDFQAEEGRPAVCEEDVAAKPFRGVDEQGGEGSGSEEGETPTNQAIDITLPVWSIEVENIGWSILRIFVPSLHGGIYQSLAQRSIYGIGAISTPERRSPRED